MLVDRGDRPPRGRSWHYALLVLVMVVPVELASAVAGRLLAARGFFYTTPDLDEYRAYQAARDPLLGWPAPRSLMPPAFDAAGSRLVPQFPDPARSPSCAAAFGDSFTWGDEVAPEDAYPSVLSELLGCRVANYGVPGYGTDQAYLRFRDRIRDQARIVVLGHWPENAIRNVNRYRGFLTLSAHGFKPRFRLVAGRLELVPLPQLDAEQLAELPERPELLPDEFFAPGGAFGLRELRFPYSWSVLGLARNYRLRAWFRGEPFHAEFYEPGHPSGALEVTVAILEAFFRDARSRGAEPVVLLIPDLNDLQRARAGQSLTTDHLAEALRARHIAFPDVAGAMLSHLSGRDPCALFTSCRHGHFNPEGYEQLARVVAEWIRERGLLRL